MNKTARLERESYCFDGTLSDEYGRELLVDCEIGLPHIWGEEAEIAIRIPSFLMPIEPLRNPCKLSSKSDMGGMRVEMREITYRSFPTSVCPNRKSGSLLLRLTHVGGMCISHDTGSIEEAGEAEEFIRIFISASGYFDEHPESMNGDKHIEDLYSFNWVRLGQVILQRYWVRISSSEGNNKILKRGYCLKVPIAGKDSTNIDFVEEVQPILNVMSILLRQRFLVHGWACDTKPVLKSFWYYPLEVLTTEYVGEEPETRLVSHKAFEKTMEIALAAYERLEDGVRYNVAMLSGALAPAIRRNSAESFMALYRVLEKQARSVSVRRTLTAEDRELIAILQRVRESLADRDALSNRVEGFIERIEQKPAVKEIILCFLQNQGVQYLDLWNIVGTNGLGELGTSWHIMATRGYTIKLWR